MTNFITPINESILNGSKVIAVPNNFRLAISNSYSKYIEEVKISTNKTLESHIDGIIEKDDVIIDEAFIGAIPTEKLKKMIATNENKLASLEAQEDKNLENSMKELERIISSYKVNLELRSNISTSLNVPYDLSRKSDEELLKIKNYYLETLELMKSTGGNKETINSTLKEISKIDKMLNKEIDPSEQYYELKSQQAYLTAEMNKYNLITDEIKAKLKATTGASDEVLELSNDLEKFTGINEKLREEFAVLKDKEAELVEKNPALVKPETVEVPLIKQEVKVEKTPEEDLLTYVLETATKENERLENTISELEQVIKGIMHTISISKEQIEKNNDTIKKINNRGMEEEKIKVYN